MIKLAEMFAIRKPILGLTIDNVEDTIVDTDPSKFSEMIKHLIFLFKLLYSLFLIIHYEV